MQGLCADGCSIEYCQQDYVSCAVGGGWNAGEYCKLVSVVMQELMMKVGIVS